MVAEPTTPSPPDRLDLIAGIDIGMAETLKAFGITRWAEIAAWRRDDLKRFGAQVVRPAAIMRQGWIEQAALLASGRLSHHAMRVLRGDFAALVSQPAVEPLPDPEFVTWHVPTVHAIAALEAPVVPRMAAIASIVANDIDALFTLPAALLTAFAPSTKTAPEVEIVTPRRLPRRPSLTHRSPPRFDRVTALEHELAAQIANDFSWSHVTAPTAPPHSPGRFSSLHIEDEEFPELHVSEADVKIVRRSPERVTTPPPIDGAATRSLLARLKRSSPLNDIDRSTYAGYRDHVEEASVEIVKAGAKGEKAAPPSPQTAAPAPGQGSLKRLLRPFTGDASN